MRQRATPNATQITRMGLHACHLVVHGKPAVQNVLQIGLHFLQLCLQPAQGRQLVLDLSIKVQEKKGEKSEEKSRVGRGREGGARTS